MPDVKWYAGGLTTLSFDGTNTILSTGGFLTPNGLATAVALGPSADPTLGFYFSGTGTSGQIHFAIAGVGPFLFEQTKGFITAANYFIAFSSANNTATTTVDTVLRRSGTSTLDLTSNGVTGAANLNVYGSLGVGTGGFAAAGGIAGTYLSLGGATSLQAGPKITLAAGTGITVNAEADVRRTMYKVTVTFAALAAAATTADVTIATIPAKMRLVGIITDTTTTYVGGAVSAATIKVGKTVAGAEYVIAHDVFTATITKGLADADLGASITRAASIQGGDLASWTATTNVSVRLTTTTANTNALTQGSTTYYLLCEAM